MGLTNRGVKVTNLHETREPHQLAILVEGGFMDSNQDIIAMRDKNKLRVQVEAVAKGVAEYFDLKKVVAPAPQDTPYTIGEWKSNQYGTQWLEAPLLLVAHGSCPVLVVHSYQRRRADMRTQDGPQNM
jgi:hypothetical protein